MRCVFMKMVVDWKNQTAFCAKPIIPSGNFTGKEQLDSKKKLGYKKILQDIPFCMEIG